MSYSEVIPASLTVEPPAPEGNRTVAEALDAWLEVSGPTWSVSTLRDQTSRVSLVKRDAIDRTVISRLTVADVDRWHARLRGKGIGESSIRNQHLVMRASMSQAARWGWVATNVVALATLGRRKTQPRSAMPADDVRAVIADRSCARWCGATCTVIG